MAMFLSTYKMNIFIILGFGGSFFGIVFFIWHRQWLASIAWLFSLLYMIFPRDFAKMSFELAEHIFILAFFGFGTMAFLSEIFFHGQATEKHGSLYMTLKSRIIFPG